MRYFVTIKYVDGTSEYVCADAVEMYGGYLVLYARRDGGGGERYIPLDQIQDWDMER